MSKADEALAERWGVSPALVLQLRGQHLKQPDDFTAEPRVIYTADGEKKMGALLKIDEKKERGNGAGTSANPWTTAAAAESPWFTPPAAPVLPEATALMILKVWPNPTFVSVRKSDGKDAIVRVRQNTRLARGGALRCRQWPDGRVECVQPGVGVPLSSTPVTG